MGVQHTANPVVFDTSRSLFLQQVLVHTQWVILKIHYGQHVHSLILLDRREISPPSFRIGSCRTQFGLKIFANISTYFKVL